MILSYVVCHYRHMTAGFVRMQIRAYVRLAEPTIKLRDGDDDGYRPVMLRCELCSKLWQTREVRRNDRKQEIDRIRGVHLRSRRHKMHHFRRDGLRFYLEVRVW